MDTAELMAARVVAALEPEHADMASGTLARGAREVASVISPTAAASLAGLLDHARIRVALTPAEAAVAHLRIRREILHPITPLAVPSRESGDPLSLVPLGQEVPDAYIWHWYPVASGEPSAARAFLSASADAALRASPARPAEAMASALLGGAEAWLGPERLAEAEMRMREACMGWLAGGRTEAEARSFAAALVSAGEDAWTRGRAFARLARAWTSVREAAWRGGGCPSREAAECREALVAWQGLLGARAAEAFAESFLVGVMGETGGHAYLSWKDESRQGIPRIDLLLAPHEGFTLSRSLEGMGHSLRILLAHELGHVLWNAWLAPEAKARYEEAWVAGAARPSVLALVSPEECFAEHVAMRVIRPWGEAYSRRRRDEVSAEGTPGPRRAAALETLALMAAFDTTAREPLEDAAGCFAEGP